MPDISPHTDDDLLLDDAMNDGGEGVDVTWTSLDEDDAAWIADDLADVLHEEEEAGRPYIGRVAVVGYPNVGKSSIVNRLSGTRTAIVHETAGVTRDRKEVPCEWNGKRFLLIDTGGVDNGDPRPMAKQIIEQVHLAIHECDLVLLVCDGNHGVSAADHEIAELLRTSNVETIVLANKLDNVRREAEAAEFWSLGLGEPMALSAHHGNNTGDLLDTVVTRLLDIGTPFSRDDDTSIRIAVVGRPNVGKSTLVNAILGDQRMIVADMPGTTRDAVDTVIDFEGRELVLIDTAGIRRRRTGQAPLDYYSEVRALQAADRADVALLLVDASEGVREHDLAVADQVRGRNCATLVVLSKWDINEVDLGDVQDTLARKLRQRPELVTTSGVTGRNISKVLQRAVELVDRSRKKIRTPELNVFLRDLKQLHPPPMDKQSRRRLNILYGTQIKQGPPTFRVFVNDKHLMTRNYGFMVENRMRERFGFEGCPLVIEYRSRS